MGGREAEAGRGSVKQAVGRPWAGRSQLLRGQPAAGKAVPPRPSSTHHGVVANGDQVPVAHGDALQEHLQRPGGRDEMCERSCYLWGCRGPAGAAVGGRQPRHPSACQRRVCSSRPRLVPSCNQRAPQPLTRLPILAPMQRKKMLRISVPLNSGSTMDASCTGEVGGVGRGAVRRGCVRAGAAPALLW